MCKLRFLESINIYSLTQEPYKLVNSMKFKVVIFYWHFNGGHFQNGGHFEFSCKICANSDSLSSLKQSLTQIGQFCEA